VEPACQAGHLSVDIDDVIAKIMSAIVSLAALVFGVLALVPAPPFAEVDEPLGVSLIVLSLSCLCGVVTYIATRIMLCVIACVVVCLGSVAIFCTCFLAHWISNQPSRFEPRSASMRATAGYQTQSAQSDLIDVDHDSSFETSSTAYTAC
jgi:hypothetical protein